MKVDLSQDDKDSIIRIVALTKAVEYVEAVGAHNYAPGDVTGVAQEFEEYLRGDE